MRIFSDIFSVLLWYEMVLIGFCFVCLTLDPNLITTDSSDSRFHWFYRFERRKYFINFWITRTPLRPTYLNIESITAFNASECQWMPVSVFHRIASAKAVFVSFASFEPLIKIEIIFSFFNWISVNRKNSCNVSVKWVEWVDRLPQESRHILIDMNSHNAITIITSIEANFYLKWRPKLSQRCQRDRRLER